METATPFIPLPADTYEAGADRPSGDNESACIESSAAATITATVTGATTNQAAPENNNTIVPIRGLQRAGEELGKEFRNLPSNRSERRKRKADDSAIAHQADDSAAARQGATIVRSRQKRLRK